MTHLHVGAVSHYYLTDKWNCSLSIIVFIIFSGSAVCCHTFSSEYSALIGRNSSELLFKMKWTEIILILLVTLCNSVSLSIPSDASAIVWSGRFPARSNWRDQWSSWSSNMVRTLQCYTLSVLSLYKGGAGEGWELMYEKVVVDCCLA